MKKLLAGCAAVCVLVLAAIVALGLLLPEGWSARATTEIHVPSERVHAAIANLRSWPAWTAWDADRDATCTFEYEGEPGLGMRASWSGERTPPATLRITAADPARELAYTLDFPTLATDAPGRFEYADAGPPEAPHGVTRVTWTVAGACSGWKGGLQAFLLERAMPRTLETGLQELKRGLETGKL